MKLRQADRWRLRRLTDPPEDARRKHQDRDENPGER